MLAHSLSALAVQLQGARLIVMALRDGARAGHDRPDRTGPAARLRRDHRGPSRRAGVARGRGTDDESDSSAEELRELGRAHPDATVEVAEGAAARRAGGRDRAAAHRQEALSNARSTPPTRPPP
nr:hypothetical protein [Pseudonocardia sp. ICBG601]